MLQSTTVLEEQQSLSCPGMPLAIYREVVAHLRQVSGVEVVLLPQRSPKFDYLQSQIGGMVLTYPAGCSVGDRQKIERILQFYSQKYGDWIVHEDSV